MTEQEWLVCCDPHRMLNFLRGRWQGRKQRLFAAACCRQIAHHFPGNPLPGTVLAAERYADGVLSVGQLRVAQEQLLDRMEVVTQAGSVTESFFLNAGYEAASLDPDGDGAFVFVARNHAADAVWALAGEDMQYDEARLEAMQKAKGTEEKKQAAILRHIIGHPFRHYLVPASWPVAAVELAQALYDGTGGRLILADALEEAGHQELAEHFRAEELHPKGCWAMDLVLGKQ
ncbi:hypothetical protein AYO44_09215 [Planctomycetaceae bacterium SCGC AG-212-F19]|nr:hypothetical protein AYO44_09215 [Planctomycetaceae bacterium SCGC AG-212-F19]